MSYQIETEEMGARLYAGVRSVVEQQDIADAIAASFGKTWNWCEENGIERQGMPITVYHNVDHSAGQYDIQPSFFIASAADEVDDISTGKTTAGAVLTTTHIGEYEGLPSAWAAVYTHAEEHGLAPAGSPWEEYIDDPGSVVPEELRTRVFLPVCGN